MNLNFKLSLRSTMCALIVVVLATTQSCRKTQLEPLSKEMNSIDRKSPLKLEPLSSIEKKIVMEDFAALLAKAVKDDSDLRNFLKEEALKRFNLDYDIMYQLVKDKMISNRGTFRQVLLKYADNEDALNAIENQLPLLTIMIPELPSGFSAETWKADSDVPAVSTGFVYDKKIKFYMSDGTQMSFESNLYPGFPLLVIKENDRVKVVETSVPEKATTRLKTLASNLFNFEFLSENFDGTLQSNAVSANRMCVGCTLDSKVEDAYQMWYNDPSSEFWQRDHVYYSLTNSVVDGPLDTRYQEHLTAIKFKTGFQAYDHITDQDDPTAEETSLGDVGSWTEGYYEFELMALVNNTQGGGAMVTKTFPVTPSQLFHVTWQQLPSFPWPLYIIVDIYPLEYNMSQVIAAWDIKNNGVAWNIKFAEVDLTQSITNSETVSSQVAANFGFDITWGKEVKKGLKFGISGQTSTTNVYSVVTQAGNDQCGSGLIYFYDPIVIWDDIIPHTGQTSYTFKELDTGWALLTIEPKRVF